jgi:NAD(P)H-dependent FMN reductase
MRGNTAPVDDCSTCQRHHVPAGHCLQTCVLPFSWMCFRNVPGNNHLDNPLATDGGAGEDHGDPGILSTRRYRGVRRRRAACGGRDVRSGGRKNTPAGSARGVLRQLPELHHRAGPDRGRCLIADDVPAILDALEASDAFVLAAPVNFWTVTALMKRFIERTVCCGYWPWGGAPKPRRSPGKRAAVITASAAPAIMARFGTNAGKLLRRVARLLGAKQVDTLWIGLARRTSDAGLPDNARARARALGRRLAAPGA